mgnify:CR=1 FL=1
MPRKTATIYICTKRSGSRNVLKGRAQAYGVRRTGTRKVNAENERKNRIPNQRKISAKSGAQKLNKNQNADIKCVKKISTRIASGISLYKKRPLSQVNCSNLYRQHKLDLFKFGGGLFAAKIYRSASSTAFLRFLSIQSDAMSEIASDFDFSLTDFMILLFKECSVFAG